MPVLLFTVDEVGTAMIARQRKLSTEIRELSDLKQKPLDPGESVATRHHKIAKLGKQLADAFADFDTFLSGLEASDNPAAEPESSATPVNPTTTN